MPISDRDYYRRAAPRTHLGHMTGPPSAPVPLRRSRRQRTLWTIPLAALLWFALGFAALWIVGTVAPERLWGPVGTASLVACAIVAVLLVRRVLRS